MNKPILVYRNQSEIDNTLQHFGIYAPDYQRMIDEFADLNIGAVETSQDFNDACTNPMEFLKRKVTERIQNNPVQIAGINLKTDKVIELLDVNDVSQFKAAAAAARNSMHFFQRIGKIEHGKAVVDKNLLDQYSEGLTIYARGEKQLQVLRAINLISEAATILKEVGKTPNLAGSRLSDYIRDNGDAGYGVNHERFQFHTNGL